MESGRREEGEREQGTGRVGEERRKRENKRTERTGNGELLEEEEEEREQENGENRKQGGEETKQRNGGRALIIEHHARWCDIPRTQLACARGGFPILRHNEIRDVTADLLSEVCHDVRTEPDLQPLTGESLVSRSSVTSEGARLDIAVNGFWGGRYERTYLDVRVFNPHAPSNRNTSITNCYRKHEAEKKRAYEQRIREVEHSSFTPLVFSATGGMGKQGSTFYALLAEKRNESYSSTLSWIRCLLSFSLLRSAIQCIRGARSSCGHAFKSSPPIDLVIHQALIG